MDPAKTRLIEAGIALLAETQDMRKVTTRAIAQRAGVGIGLLNYHFRSKDELLRLAVQGFVGRILGQWRERIAEAPSGGRGQPPAEAWILAELGALCDFLVAHPRLARASILFDLEAAAEGDNTAAAGEAVAGLLAALPGLDRDGAMRSAEMLVALIQHRFLRSAPGEDFQSPAWREAWLADSLRRLGVTR